jgi:hypothetical protein
MPVHVADETDFLRQSIRSALVASSALGYGFAGIP